jgi:hypothetical protein
MSRTVPWSELTDLVIKPTTTPGYESVHRTPDELLFAVIHHPPGSRRWHITYRGSSHPNVSCNRRADVIAELEAIVRVCSAAQLGLPEPEEAVS